MNIALVTEVIHPGGAETFVLRLASALREQGHTALIYCFYKKHYNKELHHALAPTVQIIWPQIPWLFKQMDRVLFKLKIDYSFSEGYIKKGLEKIIQVLNADVVHSHLLKVDKVCLEAGNETNVPVVTTIHGDYLQFYNKAQQNIPIPLLNYEEKARKNLKELREIVCISDKQMDFFREIFPNETYGKLVKIYNGYRASEPEIEKSVLKNQLNIGSSDFVFGMVSRGIPEKGWEEAIQALLQLNNEQAHLILVGNSNYLQTLKNKYAQCKNIHFVGESKKPLEWINIFDIGLLPSTYASESLPTVVIEYLCCNKPVIASDAGEIVNMIQCDGKKAGTIISIKDNKISVSELADAMNRYMSDKDHYSQHKGNIPACFEQFDMLKCIDYYMKVYSDATGK
ncbi:MAG TPA: glycosyltransferase family 4 protein [Flavipsychrobacter sp.]|nr:glycosyltransferase family 4 protein [Flavipsychrobacter sp.]